MEIGKRKTKTVENSGYKRCCFIQSSYTDILQKVQVSPFIKQNTISYGLGAKQVLTYKQNNFCSGESLFYFNLKNIPSIIARNTMK